MLTVGQKGTDMRSHYTDYLVDWCIDHGMVVPATIGAPAYKQYNDLNRADWHGWITDMMNVWSHSSNPGSYFNLITEGADWPERVRLGIHPSLFFVRTYEQFSTVVLPAPVRRDKSKAYLGMSYKKYMAFRLTFWSRYQK